MSEAMNLIGRERVYGFSDVIKAGLFARFNGQ